MARRRRRQASDLLVQTPLSICGTKKATSSSVDSLPRKRQGMEMATMTTKLQRSSHLRVEGNAGEVVRAASRRLVEGAEVGAGRR